MITLMFVSVALICFAIVMTGTRQQGLTKSLKIRLASIRDSAKNATTGAPLLDLTEVEQLGPIARLDAFIAQYGVSKKLTLLLLHANSSAKISGVLLNSVASACGAALVMFLFFQKSIPVLAAFLAGSLLPLFLLRFKKARRLKKFGVAMPDAIDLLARSLRAGHSVSAALEMVAEQSPEPLGSEFSRVFQQQRFGLRFRDALIEMADRVPSADLHFLVTAILVQRETGGDLTEILDRTTHVIRERVRIEGEVQTYTAQGRLTGWILSLLPIVLLVLINIISPGYSRMLFTDPTGQKMLYVGGALIMFGAFLISRIVDIKV